MCTPAKSADRAFNSVSAPFLPFMRPGPPRFSPPPPLDGRISKILKGSFLHLRHTTFFLEEGSCRVAKVEEVK